MRKEKSFLSYYPTAVKSNGVKPVVKEDPKPLTESSKALEGDSILGDEMEYTVVDEDDDDLLDDDKPQEKPAPSSVLAPRITSTLVSSSGSKPPTPTARVVSWRDVNIKPVTAPPPSSTSEPAVSTALSISTTAAALTSDDDSSGERYHSVFYGLTLATSLLEYSLKEDKALRGSLLKQLTWTTELLHDEQHQVHALKDQEEYLADCKAMLQSSLDYTTKKLEQLQTKHSQLEAQHAKMTQDYFTLIGNEKKAIAKVDKIEQQCKDMKLQLERVKQDNQRNIQIAADAKLEGLKLQGRIEEITEELSSFETKLDIARKERDIALRERDDLVRLISSSKASDRPQRLPPSSSSSSIS